MILRFSDAQTVPLIPVEKDIVYGHTSGVDLKFDLARPIEGNGPFPAVLFYHGGGWQAGDKSHGHGKIREFAENGFVGVTIGYRFAPQFKWPSQVQDAKAAVRYLRAHAMQLNIDPDRIGVVGESAGGYLALMLGMTGPADGLDGDAGAGEFSSRVQAVVSFVSATDFTAPRKELSPELQAEMMRYYKKPLGEVLSDFTGTRDPSDPLLSKISVLTYVDGSDSPVLMIYGDADPFVPLDHAKKLGQSLQNAGVRHELFIVKGGGHGWTGPLLEETNQEMLVFLKRELKQK